MNPYTILGVDRAATDAEIKKAFRARAKELHPDTAEGDKELMQKLNEANEILSDPVKRAHYDATGYTDKPPVLSMAEAKMMSLVNQAVSEVCTGQGGSIGDRVRHALNGLEEHLLDEMERMRNFHRQLDLVAKTIGYKGKGRNLIAGHIALLRKNRDEAEPQMNAELDAIREARTLFDDYEFQAQAARYMISSFGGGAFNHTEIHR